jgi:hypothetical protein
MADDDYGVLRVDIDGDWSCIEFSKLFDQFEMLNLMAGWAIASQDEQQGRLFIETAFAFHGRPLRFSPAWTPSYELELKTEDYFREIALRKYMNDLTYLPELRVGAIHYASPGWVDLLGAGRIVGHVSKFILGITDRYLAREDRALAREQTKQKILKDKISNAKELLKLGTKIHMDPEAQRQLVRRALEIDEYIENKLIDQQITGINQIGPGSGQVRKRPPK